MTKSILAALAATVCISTGATINYSTTTTGSRVVTSTTPSVVAVPAGSLIRLGTMTSENNSATFLEFGTSTINSNGAFTGGIINGSVVNNTATASDFASRPIYIAVYNTPTSTGATYAGIFKSTSIFDSTISSSGSQTFTLTVASFTTAINPTDEGWKFLPASVNPSGITGAAGNPATDRTGIVFTLGAAVPEASSSACMLLVAMGALVRRKRR